jgi:transcription initiation factor IIE alpha subunit
LYETFDYHSTTSDVPITSGREFKEKMLKSLKRSIEKVCENNKFSIVADQLSYSFDEYYTN